MMIKKEKYMNKLGKVLALTTLASLISACGGSDGDNALSPSNGSDAPQQRALVAAIASDYQSSSISIVDNLAAPNLVNGFVPSDKSDIAIAAYGDAFYRIGRFGQDNITKYAFDSPSVAHWQFSTNDEGETSSNPGTLVFQSETKAYLLRYGTGKLWIINPSVAANDEASFKLGEIDLSRYDSSDNIPEMSSAVIHNSVLYITLQGLDRNDGWTPKQAYLVAIDLNTNQEIQLAPAGAALPGLPLTVKNPVDLDYFDNALYITGVGIYGNSFAGTETEYSGGIEKVNLSNFTSELVLDDGTAANHPYGQISGLQIVSETQFIFKGYAGWQNVTLFHFDPTSGSVAQAPFANLANQDIRAVALEGADRLWVGIGSETEPSIRVFNTTSGVLEQDFPTNKNPGQIVFVK